MNDVTVECAEYFRSVSGFQRIMPLLLARYRRNGYAAGTVHLEKATDQEREALCGLFGRPFPAQVKFKVQDFDAALQASRFQGVDLKAVLEAYFQTPIHTSKELKDRQTRQFETIIRAAGRVARSPVCKAWLSRLQAKRPDSGYPLLRKEMSKSPESAEETLCRAIWAADELERYTGTALRLAVFSAQATTDPHALNGDSLCGKLFLHLLSAQIQRPFPQTAEERDMVYYENGILCDSISSTVTQVGLILNEQHQEHPAFRELRLRHQCATLSLTNLNTVFSAASPSGKAFLVENQMLFSQLADYANRFHSPLICTSGQLQVAVLRLLDMLADAGTTLYYAGDFDGGGISIAARLLARYPGQLKLWHMEESDYVKCRSEVGLSGKSLGLLRTARGTALEPIAQAVAAHGYGGYQELLLEELLSDLILPETINPEYAGV